MSRKSRSSCGLQLETLEDRSLLAGNPLAISEVNYHPADAYSGAFDSDLIGNHPTFLVDFQASYKIGSGVKLTVEAQNLTDEANIQYIDSVRQDSLFALRTGRTFSVGLSWNL